MSVDLVVVNYKTYDLVQKFLDSAVMVHDWHGTIKRFGGDELFEVSRRGWGGKYFDRVQPE